VLCARFEVRCSGGGVDSGCGECGEGLAEAEDLSCGFSVVFIGKGGVVVVVVEGSIGIVGIGPTYLLR